MFERFTDRARRVVVLAQEEARMLNHNYIGTEHILLGLIHEGEGVAAKALESLGISLDAVRQQVEEIIGQAGLAHAAPFVAHLLGVARCDVARHQVPEGRVLALQEVVALRLGNLAGRALIALLGGHPDAAVVAQRLAHQGEFRLVLARYGDARGMDLRKAGIREQRAVFVRAPDGGGVGTLGVGGKVIRVPVTAGTQHHRLGQVRFDLAGEQVPRDDAARLAIDRDQVEHLGARVHFHLPRRDLPLQRLVGAEKQLLAGLAARVERARNLRAAERAVVQVTRVFARERHALRHALVDDVDADLRQAVDVGFARPEIAALHRVVEETVHAVAVVVIILGGVDAALRRDGVRAPGRILETEALDVVAQLRQAGGRGTARQSGAHNDDRMLALVGRIHQLEVEAMAVPSRFDRASGAFRIEFHAWRYLYFSQPARAATGMEILPMAIRRAQIAANRFSLGV